MVNIDQQADFYGDKITPWSAAEFEMVCAPPPGPTGGASNAKFASITIRASLSSIECPRCPHCQVRIALEQVSAASPGYDLRTFECAKCDRISIRLVPHDPMKVGDALRWLGSELKRPN